MAGVYYYRTQMLMVGSCDGPNLSFAPQKLGVAWPAKQDDTYAENKWIAGNNRLILSE